MGKPVRVEWSKQDRYGRLVGKVWVTPMSCPATRNEAVPEDPGRQPRPTHGRPGLALQGIPEGTERGRPPPLRLRRTGSTGTQSGPLERTRSDAAWDWQTRHHGGPTKKATKSGICHAPGTPGYSSTKKFTKYPTLEACLASGGRLPKKIGLVIKSIGCPPMRRVKEADVPLGPRSARNGHAARTAAAPPQAV